MIRFYSKSQNYQILIKPYIINVQNGIPIHSRGEKVEFENGEFSTGDQNVIKFLRKHAAYGVDFEEDKTPVGADEKIFNQKDVSVNKK